MEDILKEVGYSINGSEVGFFGVVLQKENERIVPTYISIGDPGDEVKKALADSLIRLANNIKEGLESDNYPVEADRAQHIACYICGDDPEMKEFCSRCGKPPGRSL